MKIHSKASRLKRERERKENRCMEGKREREREQGETGEERGEQRFIAKLPD